MAGTSNQEGKADNGFLAETFGVDRKGVLTEGNEGLSAGHDAGICCSPQLRVLASVVNPGLCCLQTGNAS
jgi:hypothetical protein